MNLNEAGQYIINAVVKYSSWTHAPSSAPAPITIANTWEGPLPFFIDNFETASYPILVILPNIWPQLNGPRLHQIPLVYSGSLNYLYKASEGENPFEKAREGISKICLNLLGSNRLGLPWVNDLIFGSLRCPAADADVMQYLFGMQIASASLDFTVTTTLVI
jgi:hypothetical protein